MMRRVLLSAFLWVVAAAAQGQAAHDPCDQLLETDKEDRALTWHLSNLFSEGPETSETGGFGDDDYFVTIRAGRFANVSCNDREFEFQEMYPIGIVLRPLYRLDLPRFEDAGEGKPILVVTEYGHRKIVSEDDIARIEDGSSYVFADSYAKSMICREADACPGNGEDICDDGRCRYDISAKFGYAIAPSGDPAAAAALAAYGKLRADSLILPEIELSRDEIARAQADICVPFPVKAYLRGGELTQQGDSYLTLCAQREEYGAAFDGYAPLKIVDRASAERVFAHGLNGSFHRRFGEGMSALDQFVATIGNANVTSSKACGVAVANVGTLEYGGGMNVKANAGVLSINLGAERTQNSEISETLSSDDFLLFSTYFVEPIPNADAPEDAEDLWLFRIVFRSACEDRLPARPSSIKVYYDRLPAGSVEIGAKGDLFKAYTENWENVSFIPLTDPAFLQEGQFWEIRDPIGYFIWRDTLRDYLLRIPGTGDLISAYPVEQRPVVRDFFVYLMLAAAYRHQSP